MKNEFKIHHPFFPFSYHPQRVGLIPVRVGIVDHTCGIIQVPRLMYPDRRLTVSLLFVGGKPFIQALRGAEFFLVQRIVHHELLCFIVIAVERSPDKIAGGYNGILLGFGIVPAGFLA
jgi:hypothetical protein